MEASRVRILKHEPERRRRAITTVCCGCSCCCCCCLHSLGSLIGAAVAPAFGSGSPLIDAVDRESGSQTPFAHEPEYSAVSVFWWVLCFLVFVGGVASIITLGSGVGGLIILVMGLPLLQLASALITLVIFVGWRRQDTAYQLKQLAKITGGIVLGSIVGILAMLGIAAMFETFG